MSQVSTDFFVRAPHPLQVIGHSGLFDAAYYLKHNPDLLHLGSGVLAHYHHHGWKEGRKPNPYFDPLWYVVQYRDVVSDPLLHYIQGGEAQGRRPIAWFDPDWYAQQHDIASDMLVLTHFLRNRNRHGVRPMAEFDPGFYLRENPDVAASGLDPLEHYMIQGFREIRRPFEGFDPQFYRARYLRHDPEANPLLHYLANRERPGVYPSRPADETTIAREVTRNTRPGPFFEAARSSLPQSAERRARVLAYYLPQFHTIAENDAWWGPGFTEWTNVARGMPRFADHYQPRIPRDLGHYLLDNPDILRRQAEMAKNAGIEGFVFYFYWFNGRRLLERPLEMLLADRSIDLPFCLMWANENWTRRWDGSEQDILIAQDYAIEDEIALVATLARHFADPRYIRLGGRPVLMVYRADAIPDAPRAVARWRALFRSGHQVDPVFIMGQVFGCEDPRDMGMDAAIEFPPHKITNALPTINASLNMLDDDVTAQIYDYADAVDLSLGMKAPAFPLIRTACPSWDNDARRQGKGLVLHGSTPALYERWLAGLIEQAQANRVFGEAIVCVNAWNEWAEGAYLEPDQHFGSAYLNATARAVAGFGTRGSQPRILLVGHDAFEAGAQHLLLQIGKSFKRVHGAECRFVLLDDGALIDRYQAVATTEILPERGRVDRFRILAQEGFGHALVNSAASAAVVSELVEAGFDVTLLVHELPGLLRQRGLAVDLARACGVARNVVVPAVGVATRLAEANALGARVPSILPQGLYQRIRFEPEKRAVIRQALGLQPRDRLVIGAGYGDMRKGFDLFLQAWRRAWKPGGRSGHVRFVWAGALDPALQEGLSADLAYAEGTGTFHLPGQVARIGEWLSAADAFALTSREDPYPSVVLEALACGLPVCAFAGSGGIPDLLREKGDHAVVPMGDLGRLHRALMQAASATHMEMETHRLERARDAAARLDFAPYAARLLGMVLPEAPSVSVVVPSYNYARYLSARLASIFAQTHPVLEIIVLDDASCDDSVTVARRTAREWGREIEIVPSARNSGSAFGQWARACKLARGEWIWIAEADDLSDPEQLARLCASVVQAPGAVMGFCDSRRIDAQGAPQAGHYKDYYAASAPGLLDQDGVHEGPAFVAKALAERNLILNVSSVLFRREALSRALDECAGELAAYRIAGDWRIYLSLLAKPGAVLTYVAEALNIHRRHDGSTSGTMPSEAHLAEIAAIHAVLDAQAPTDFDGQARRAAYRAQIGQQFAGIAVMAE